MVFLLSVSTHPSHGWHARARDTHPLYPHAPPPAHTRTLHVGCLRRAARAARCARLCRAVPRRATTPRGFLDAFHRGLPAYRCLPYHTGCGRAHAHAVYLHSRRHAATPVTQVVHLLSISFHTFCLHCTHLSGSLLRTRTRRAHAHGNHMVGTLSLKPLDMPLTHAHGSGLRLCSDGYLQCLL